MTRPVMEPVTGPAISEPDQLAVSAQLAGRIAERIDAAGGWIGFDAWMSQALYEPGLGYYTSASRKFGAAGDFVTAPELTPLFGRSLAVQLAQWFSQGAPPTVFEFGAGSGALAATLLEALAGEAPPGQERCGEARSGPVPSNERLARDTQSRFRYRIVELSAELRARQREMIAARVPALLDRVEWLDSLPQRIEGIVLGNELLDAMPVRLFRLRGNEVLERGVVRARSGPAAFAVVDRRADAAFAFADRPADDAFAATVRSALDRSGWATQSGWPDGYTSEIGDQAAAWVATIGARLTHGALLLIDYGFPVREFYHPQRAEGTLICHYRHRSHDDPLWQPGLQDITAHVNFTAIVQAARDAGLAPLGYSSQASFLIACGLPELAMQVPRHDVLGWARQASALQRLLSEAEMGELLKAVAFGRGLPDDAIGFSRSDRRAVLLPAAPDSMAD